MRIKYVKDTDVLVIGGGGAGIKAAIKAGEAGVSVLLATKCKFGYSGASFYPGMDGWGINAILHEGDSEDNFYEEIIEAGAGAADKKLARILVEQCTVRFHEMESYGVEFSKDENGRYNSVISCFGKRVRGACADLNMIKKALWEQLMKNNVTIRSGINIISLIVDNGICYGAVGFDEMNELMLIRAKSTIIATGGGCDLYKYSLAMPDQTGDGYIMALEAGARLVNLEFIQFIPGLTWPTKKLLFQEKNLDTFPQIQNRFGEDVLPKYLPEGITSRMCLTERAKNGPFTSADISKYFDIALYEEWQKGNVTDSGGIHFRYDRSVLDDKRWIISEGVRWMKSRNIDVVQEGFDIIPHAQCFNGGIYIDENANVGIKGLFAAGETSGGPHGADRLGGNAQAATQVFGVIAGMSAAQWAKDAAIIDINREDIIKALQKKFDTGSRGLAEMDALVSEIKDIMWQSGAIVRSEDRIKEGLRRLADIERSFNPWEYFESNIDIKKASGLYSRIHLSRILLEVMLYRKESRGPHYRIDYPEKNSEFEGMIAVKKQGDTLSLTVLKQ